QETTIAITDIANKPFQLDKGPLFRLLVAEDKDDFYITLTMHHIITDGWSMSMLLTELRDLYFSKLQNNDTQVTDTQRTLRYVDIARWMSGKIESGRNAIKKYWA